MTRVMIIGAQGQLASAFLEHLPTRYETVVISRRAIQPPLRIDLTTPGAIRRCIRIIKPDLVINTAAYTEVDRAEEARDEAWRVNADAVGELALELARCNGVLIHFSTDYVFSGSSTVPYVEQHAVSPINHYGASKLAGEEAVRASGVDHLIVRTSWLYGPTGKNFLKTIKAKAEAGESLRVVDDQLGQPTSAVALTRAICRLLDAENALQWLRTRRGTYHVAAGGSCSWYDFAKLIVSYSKRPEVRIEPVASHEFATRAKRPAFSVLDTRKASVHLQLSLADWRDEANRMLALEADKDPDH